MTRSKRLAKLANKHGYMLFRLKYCGWYKWYLIPYAKHFEPDDMVCDYNDIMRCYTLDEVEQYLKTHTLF